jgi:ergothioneine biosynthesis protein EgtB
MTPRSDRLQQRFVDLWARTDRLFAILEPEAILARPIALRHPFIFYLGHLPAFAWNHICRGLLGAESVNPRFDDIFDRGIDPDVDDPEHCHDHPDVPALWPELKEVVGYRDRAREAILESCSDSRLGTSTDIMAEHGRVFSMAIEHELMHQETLLYMMQQLPRALKRRPESVPPYVIQEGRRAETVEVGEGIATLGAPFDALEFGWDNEFPTTRVGVPRFAVDSTPVTNEQFMRFVASGGYDCAAFWSEPDWKWKRAIGLAHPLCWVLENGVWFHRTIFDVVSLSEARDWPVHVSLAEAQAYARWSGGRLLTEAEFHRAAYGQPDGEERAFPWGDEPPTARHANVNFVRWLPEPIGSHPAGASAWGVHDLIGDGWEWTETVFGPFAGFSAYIERYPGYSADFFDGKHYVVKGGSWATDVTLIRPSFRNWYQARYPYVFAKFRCVRSI